MTQNLEGMGFTVVPFGQGYKDMSPPIFKNNSLIIYNIRSIKLEMK